MEKMSFRLAVAESVCKKLEVLRDTAQTEGDWYEYKRRLESMKAAVEEIKAEEAGVS